jgi:hypothetical protein
MSETTTHVTAQVDLVLARTGLVVTAEERERLIRVYPTIAEWMAGLRIPETRYAEPALIYPAPFER